MDENLERQRRRREWADVRPDEELDRRHTRELKAKHYKFNISMPPGLFMQMEAARRKLDFGNGMSRSRLLRTALADTFTKNRWTGSRATSDVGVSPHHLLVDAFQWLHNIGRSAAH